MLNSVTWTSSVELPYTEVYLFLRPPFIPTVEAIIKWEIPTNTDEYRYAFSYDDSLSGVISEQDITGVIERVTSIPVVAKVVEQEIIGAEDIAELVVTAVTHWDSIKPKPPTPIPSPTLPTEETDPVFTEWISKSPSLSSFSNDVGYITEHKAEEDPVFNTWLQQPPKISTFENDVPYLTHEIDPLFTAWLKKRPNVSQFINDVGYAIGGVEVEIDPIFMASPAATITAADIINWNTPYVEIDPIFTAWLSVPPGISTFVNDVGYITAWGPETDPVFNAWLLGPPNVSTFVNDVGYLTSVTPHPLLNTTHSDTVPGAVVKGDIIVGNASPDWERLAANATATNKYLRSVNGGVPSWETIAELAGYVPYVGAVADVNLGLFDLEVTEIVAHGDVTIKADMKLYFDGV